MKKNTATETTPLLKKTPPLNIKKNDSDNSLISLKSFTNFLSYGRSENHVIQEEVKEEKIEEKIEEESLHNLDGSKLMELMLNAQEKKNFNDLTNLFKLYSETRPEQLDEELEKLELQLLEGFKEISYKDFNPIHEIFEKLNSWQKKENIIDFQCSLIKNNLTKNLHLRSGDIKIYPSIAKKLFSEKFYQEALNYCITALYSAKENSITEEDKDTIKKIIHELISDDFLFHKFSDDIFLLLRKYPNETGFFDIEKLLYKNNDPKKIKKLIKLYADIFSNFDKEEEKSKFKKSFQEFIFHSLENKKIILDIYIDKIFNLIQFHPREAGFLEIVDKLTSNKNVNKALECYFYIFICFDKYNQKEKNEITEKFQKFILSVISPEPLLNIFEILENCPKKVSISIIEKIMLSNESFSDKIYDGIFQFLKKHFIIIDFLNIANQLTDNNIIKLSIEYCSYIFSCFKSLNSKEKNELQKYLKKLVFSGDFSNDTLVILKKYPVETDFFSIIKEYVSRKDYSSALFYFNEIFSCFKSIPFEQKDEILKYFKHFIFEKFITGEHKNNILTILVQHENSIHYQIEHYKKDLKIISTLDDMSNDKNKKHKIIKLDFQESTLDDVSDEVWKKMKILQEKNFYFEEEIEEFCLSIDHFPTEGTPPFSNTGHKKDYLENIKKWKIKDEKNHLILKLYSIFANFLFSGIQKGPLDVYELGKACLSYFFRYLLKIKFKNSFSVNIDKTRETAYNFVSKKEEERKKEKAMPEKLEDAFEKIKKSLSSDSEMLLYQRILLYIEVISSFPYKEDHYMFSSWPSGYFERISSLYEVALIAAKAENIDPSDIFLHKVTMYILKCNHSPFFFNKLKNIIHQEYLNSIEKELSINSTDDEYNDIKLKLKKTMENLPNIEETKKSEWENGIKEEDKKVLLEYEETLLLYHKKTLSIYKKEFKDLYSFNFNENMNNNTVKVLTKKF